MISPIESLKELETIKVGDMRLLIDEGWLLIFETSITVAPPGRYRFEFIPRAIRLHVDDYQGVPWSHDWSIAEIIQMKGAFERIFPQPRR